MISASNESLLDFSSSSERSTEDAAAAGLEMFFFAYFGVVSCPSDSSETSSITVCFVFSVLNLDEDDSLLDLVSVFSVAFF